MESAEIQNSHSPQRISTSLPPISKEETGKSNKNRRKKLEKIRMENNATTIQKVWRGKQSRLELSRKVASLENFAPIKGNRSLKA